MILTQYKAIDILKSLLNNQRGKTKFIITVFVSHQSQKRNTGHQSKLKWKIPTLVKMFYKSNNHDVIRRSSHKLIWI